MTSRYDAVICGAGVAGLILARALGEQGMRVLVADKQRSQRQAFKGELLQPRSLEICAALGILPSLLASGALVTRRLTCRNPDGSEVGALDYQQLCPPFNYCLVHDYQSITQAMAGTLGATVEVRRGTRVDDLLADASGRVTGVSMVGPSGRYQLSAGLVVGCDGPASTVRKQAGIRVESRGYRHELLALDLREVSGVDQDIGAYLTPEGLRLLYAMPGGRARLYIQLELSELRRLGRAGLAGLADRVIAGTPALEPIAPAVRAAIPGARAFSARRFMAPRWIMPGVALAGDAAHCTHPMAGQGMNAAIADGYELAAQLARAPGLEEALRRYEGARRAHLAYVGRLSHSLATLFTDTSWPTRAIGRRMLARNRSNQRLQYVLTYNMSGLGVQRFTLHDRLVQFGLAREPAAGWRK